MLILTRFLGVDGVWYSLPLSDMLAFGLSVALAVRESKRLKQLEINGKGEENESRLYLKEQQDL